MIILEQTKREGDREPLQPPQTIRKSTLALHPTHSVPNGEGLKNHGSSEPKSPGKGGKARPIGGSFKGTGAEYLFKGGMHQEKDR